MSAVFENSIGDCVSAQALAAVDTTTDQASGLPNEAYTSERFFAFERDALFARTWTCIGRASDLARPGDARPVSFMGLPLVLVKDGQGVLRVFHNVCSHRGNRVVHAPCRTQGALRCPYHSWTYGLDGRLKGTPHIGGVGKHELEGFDRDAHGLREVRSAVWLDLVFVDLSGEASELETHLAPLVSRWRPYVDADALAALAPAATHGAMSLELAANWKLAVENYCESYHLPWVHPGLNRYSKIEDHYHILEPGRFAGQGTRVYDPVYLEGPAFPGFAGWPAESVKVAEYVALFPNVLLGLHVDHVYTIILDPVACDRTVESFRFYYLGDATIWATPQARTSSRRRAPRALPPGRRSSSRTWASSRGCSKGGGRPPSAAASSRP